MKKFLCTVCGYLYDEAAGIPEQGIAPGTSWENLSEEWICPLCGAGKDEFREQTVSEKSSASQRSTPGITEEMPVLSFGELQALFLNLSKGCAKQDRTEDAGLFAQLADYYKKKSIPVEGKELEELLAFIKQDLEDRFPEATAVATEKGDRGALRALAWSEKVTRIVNSLLVRYEKQKETMLEDTNLYVCEICGFLYLGPEVPEICPVCKVPNLKIRKTEKEAV